MSREVGAGNRDRQAAAEPLDLATATGVSILRDGRMLTFIDAAKKAGADLSAVKAAYASGDAPAVVQAIDDVLAHLRSRPEQEISELVQADPRGPLIRPSDDSFNRRAELETPDSGRLKIALRWAALVAVLFIAHHYLIKVPAQQRVEEEARIAALESKILSNFDNYLKAAPLLKGETAEVFAKTVDEKIDALGYSPSNPRYQGMTPGQRWRAARMDKTVDSVRIAAEHAKREAADQLLVNESMEKCRASFSEDCHDMIQLWLCVSGKHCTEHATEWLREYVEEVVDSSGPDPNYGYCVDRTAQCVD